MKIKPETIQKNKDKKQCCPICKNEVYSNDEEFNPIAFIIIGFAILMLVVIPLIWR